MITQTDRSIYLASRSPRRRELLAQIGVRFQVLMFRDKPETDAELDETPLAGEAPHAYVERVARAKAQAGWRRLEQRNLPRAAVLSADTTVAVDGRILGKPADRREAAAMLGALSGRRHEVLTAIALKDEAQLECALSVSRGRVQAAVGGGHPPVRRHRRVRRQGRRLRDPGPRRAVRRRACTAVFPA